MIYFVVVLLVFLSSKPLSVFLGISFIKALPYVLLIIGIIQHGFFNRGYFYIGRLVNHRSFLIYGIFLCILLLSFLRDSNNEMSQIGTYTTPLMYLLFVLYVYLFIVYYRKRTQDFQSFVKQIIFLIILATSLFISIDIMLYLLGVTSGGEGGETFSVVGSVLGLAIERINFVLGGHHNNFSLLIGDVIVLTLQALLLGLYAGSGKRILLVVVIVTGYALILADVRGVVLSIIISLAFVFLFKKLRVLQLLPSITFLPFLISIGFPLIQILLHSNANSLAAFTRSGEDIFTLNGRTYIWEGCLVALRSFDFHDLVGYGQVGHITSDAYLEWAWIFPGKVTHNMYFQYILDAGYLGLLSLLGIIFITAKHALDLYRAGIKSSLVFLTFLIYFSFSGIFESAIGVYNHPHTTFFLLISAVVILLKNEYVVYLNYKTNNITKQV
ncbi:O-antigen ligase family protein [Catalinimonas sp. 4WD22]|uniref:O-antigen ligase family protein n=1 Tax=Catalinimonas locisalis TaxID=3133978 RepID=UPI0031013331